jgi:hypothetical protein
VKARARTVRNDDGSELRPERPFLRGRRKEHLSLLQSNALNLSQEDIDLAGEAKQPIVEGWQGSLFLADNHHSGAGDCIGRPVFAPKCGYHLEATAL